MRLLSLLQPLILCVAVLTGALWPSLSHAATVQIPGPSIDLFNAPYYTCVHNYYVSGKTGSDRNGGSAAHPWKTLQHANDVGRQAGDCVNVAPGTYAHGIVINSGGNLASRTGYVVYRCTTMDACIVTDTNGETNGSFVWNFSTQPMTGSYVIVDGFTLKAIKPTLFGQGFQVYDGNDQTPTAPRSVHHVWLLNSIISNFGQSGVQMNDGEYFYVVHNTVYGNSTVGCSAQGSGVSFAALRAFPGYQRTADDADNPIVGAIGSFNNAIEWNVLFNNAITGCGKAGSAYDTDGNNIIADSLANQGGPKIVYPGSLLIAFNITYNAGGRGITAFYSENVTVANNTCYNSDLDPFDIGVYRPCIGDDVGYNNNFFNNIAYAIVGSGTGQCPFENKDYNCLAWNQTYVGGLVVGYPADVFTHNMSRCIGTQPYGGCTPMLNGDAFACGPNQCDTDPLWVDAGSHTAGTEKTQPNGANFALSAKSPAIGAGLTAPYLSPQSVDLGACYRTFTVCPKPAARP